MPLKPSYKKLPSTASAVKDSRPDKRGEIARTIAAGIRRRIPSTATTIPRALATPPSFPGFHFAHFLSQRTASAAAQQPPKHEPIIQTPKASKPFIPPVTQQEIQYWQIPGRIKLELPHRPTKHIKPSKPPLTYDLSSYFIDLDTLTQILATFPPHQQPTLYVSLNLNLDYEYLDQFIDFVTEHENIHLRITQPNLNFSYLYSSGERDLPSEKLNWLHNLFCPDSEDKQAQERAQNIIPRIFGIELYDLILHINDTEDRNLKLYAILRAVEPYLVRVGLNAIYSRSFSLIRFPNLEYFKCNRIGTGASTYGTTLYFEDCPKLKKAEILFACYYALNFDHLTPRRYTIKKRM